MRHTSCMLLLILSVFLLSNLVFIETVYAQTQRPERPKETATSPTVGMRDTVNPPEVKIWTDKGDNTNGNNPIYYVGERIYVSFQVDKDCYITIYDIDSTGNVNILFPNPYNKDNLARGGRIYTIPTGNYGYDLVIRGPTGKEILYALASTHVYYHWQYGVSPPPVWSDQWGAPMTWGHYGGYDYSIASRRFQKRLQVYEETNLAALTLNTLKKQIALDTTVGCPLQEQEACQCNFYVTVPPY
jgi:hypothetical protein